MFVYIYSENKTFVSELFIEIGYLSVKNDPDFQNKVETLRTLFRLRGEPREDLDQNYLTEDSIIDRMQVMNDLGMISNQRILSLGDSDLANSATSIFGKPMEVVVVDIDRRISEILFEASMEFDLPVRFVYHDMRIKLIEILFHQYTVVFLDPPPTEAGIEVFLSRAFQCIQKGFESNIFVCIPQQDNIRSFFDRYLENQKATILREFPSLNKYINGEISDMIQLKVSESNTPTVLRHWIEPFFQHEVNQKSFDYRCICHAIITVGEGYEYQNIQELKIKGHSCGHKDIFSFHSKIPLL